MRGLSKRFIDDLQNGVLKPFLDRVLLDRTLCLEIRKNYINIYYRGGSLLKLMEKTRGYEADFNFEYAKKGLGAIPISQPQSFIGQPLNVQDWIDVLPFLKLAMDLFLGKMPKEEREIQQLILRDNNFGPISRATDYYFCDLEYANAVGRFDMIGVHWPSSPIIRKNAMNRRLVLAEVKYGDNALDKKSGLHAHIQDVNSFLSLPQNIIDLKTEMLRVFNQKRELGLLDCGKDMAGFSDESPVLLLILVNHDPDKSRLGELLRTLPESPHAELRFAAASFMGYGLFDPVVHTTCELAALFGREAQ